jgi:hypothetical protein
MEPKHERKHEAGCQRAGRRAEGVHGVERDERIDQQEMAEAVAATPISRSPNHRRLEPRRGARRPQNHPPHAMPVKKMAMVSAAACAV